MGGAKVEKIFGRVLCSKSPTQAVHEKCRQDFMRCRVQDHDAGGVWSSKQLEVEDCRRRGRLLTGCGESSRSDWLRLWGKGPKQRQGKFEFEAGAAITPVDECVADLAGLVDHVGSKVPDDCYWQREGRRSSARAEVQRLPR